MITSTEFVYYMSATNCPTYGDRASVPTKVGYCKPRSRGIKRLLAIAAHFGTNRLKFTCKFGKGWQTKDKLIVLSFLNQQFLGSFVISPTHISGPNRYSATMPNPVMHIFLDRDGIRFVKYVGPFVINNLHDHKDDEPDNCDDEERYNPPLPLCGRRKKSN